MGVGCAPKGFSAAPGPTPDGDPVAGPLTPTPPAAEEDPFAGLLEPTRNDFKELGYGFRLPLGWSQPPEGNPTGSDFLLQSPGRESSIIIGRRDGTAIRHYGHWLSFCDSFEQSVVRMLSEARIVSAESINNGGKLVRLIQHTHYTGGTLRYSAKAAVWAGSSVIIINFDTLQSGWQERLPLFQAFLKDFRVLDPEAAKMPAYEPDYIGEYRHPTRDLSLPVPRGFAAAASEGAGVLGRWTLPPTSITLAEHEYTGDLESYGRFQERLVAGYDGVRDVSGNIVELSGRKAFLIDFQLGADNRSLIFIYRSKGFFYQLVLATKPFDFPFMRPLFDDLAGKFDYPEA